MIEKLDFITYTDEHDILIDRPPTIQEIQEKINEIIDYLNEKEAKEETQDLR